MCSGPWEWYVTFDPPVRSELRVASGTDIPQYIYYNSPYFLNMEELWTDWPQRELGGLMKGYILGQWSFWLQQVLILNIEARRKDHWQMLSHHLVTIALIYASYAYHQTRVGNLILVLMDIVDLVFPVSPANSRSFSCR